MICSNICSKQIQQGLNAARVIRFRFYQAANSTKMSYRLDPSTGRFVLTNDRVIRQSRMDESFSGSRAESASTSPAFRTELIRVNSQSRLNIAGNSSTPQAERIYIPSRSFVGDPVRNEAITNLKNELSTLKNEVRNVTAREENPGGPRRIVLTNGRRAFDPDTIEKASGMRQFYDQAPSRDLKATVPREFGTPQEARIIRDAPTVSTPTIRPMVRQPVLVKEFSIDNHEQRRIEQLERQIRTLQEKNSLLGKDAQLFKNELNALREANNMMQVELGSLRSMEEQHHKLKHDADVFFDENTALKNELSRLNSEIEHSNLLNRESAAILNLQEENSNLRSELSSLQNIHHQNRMLSAQLSVMRELQQENSALRSEVSNIRNLQNENSALRSELSSTNTQISLMKNDLAMMKVHAGHGESEMKQFTDHLTGQLQMLKTNLAAFEGMKRSLEGKFGYAEPLTVDDFTEKVFLMLSDNVAMMEALMLKDSQLEEFRDRMEQNQKAIEQLSNYRQGYQDNLRIMTSVQENQRHKMLDLARQLEQHKILLKKTQEELAKHEIKKNPMEDQTIVSLIRNKDVEITKLQVGVKTANNKCEHLQKELAQLKTSSQLRLVTDKNEISQSLNSQISSLTAELDRLRNDNASLDQMLQQKDQALQQLSEESNRLREQLNNTGQALEQTSIDLRRFTELYNLKDRETNDAIRNTEMARMEFEERSHRLEEEVDLLRLKLEDEHSQHKEEEQDIRRQLQQTQDNWHRRLVKELSTFDEALKEQIEQLNTLKLKVTEKDDKIFQLRDSLFTSQSSVTALRAEIQIEKLKSISERKTQQVAYEVELQNLRNDLNGAQKLADSINSKMKQVAEDSRKKDEFIQKYVMGKKTEEKFNPQLFFRQYEIVVPYSNLKAKVEEELRLIDQLQTNNRVLAQELAHIKNVEPLM